MKHYDISPIISPSTAVFPGDTPFSLKTNKDYKNGDSYSLKSITTTTHIGAHTDAPYHYNKHGDTIEKRDLNYYLGGCQVIEIENQKHITPDHIKHISITQKRVLFKTNSYPDPQTFNENFTALTPELIQWLANKEVITIGIDTPSIDVFDSKSLETHQAVFDHDMAIVEGIVLSEVPEGEYTLIALPLKLQDADSSPVRAVLLEGELSC